MNEPCWIGKAFAYNDLHISLILRIDILHCQGGHE